MTFRVGIAWIFVLAILMVAFIDDASAGFEPSLEIGFQHRVRYEGYDNLIDYSKITDDEKEYFRFRTRVWADAQISPYLGFKIQFANEFRKYLTPDQKTIYHEIFVDNCYLDLKNLGDTGFSMRIGRQNILKGDGFILSDGGPLDGSRSAYFNAVLMTYKIGTNQFEVIGLSDPATDEYGPLIEDKEQPMVEWDEKALGIYWTSDCSKGINTQVYYFYKQETDVEVAQTSPAYQPDRALHIEGARMAWNLGSGWTVTGELAGEIGSQDPDRDILAWAGYSYVNKELNAAWKPRIKIGFTALSGDDPGTNDIEGWDPAFARWPKWGDLYVYSFVKEKGVAYWSNLYMEHLDFMFTPVKPVDIRFSYYHMQAFHEFNGNPSIFGTGTNRGDNLQFRTDFAIYTGITGHVQYEYHIPGNFYAEDDAGHFLRFELTIQLAHLFKFKG
jgi:hypothetical protein